jgi:hypothetical protein
MIRASIAWVVVAACEPGAITPLPDTGGDDDDGFTIDGDALAPWVCNQQEQNGTCTMYTGVAWDENIAQQDCINGEFITEWRCPRPTLGACTMGDDQPLEQVVSYYLGDWLQESDIEAVSNNCGFAEGIWEPAY